MSGSNRFVLTCLVLFQCSCQLVRTGSGSGAAVNSVQQGDHLVYRTALHQTADSLQVAVAAASEVEILDDVILIQREVDHCGTSSFGSVLHSILLMICLLWGSEFR